MSNTGRYDLSKVNSSPDSASLFLLVQKLAEEQHPHRAGSVIVTSKTSLEADLAIDSLGRMELLERIENEFSCDIGEQKMAEAVTVQDLLSAMMESHPIMKTSDALKYRNIPHNRTNLPINAKTLLEVLEWHAEEHPDRLHVNFLVSDAEEESINYIQLLNISKQVAKSLQDQGISHGDAVGIMLPNSLDFFYAFLGIQIAGGVPVPIYPPARLNQIEDHLRRHATILDNADCKILITIIEAKMPAQFLRLQSRSMRKVMSVEELKGNGKIQSYPVISEASIAFLQYTSGSTGNPKGVILTHQNLLSNIRAMGEPFELDPDGDVFVSWLPLYHDMGLIGAWMCSLYYAMPLILMSPQHFLNRPERWLRAIHEYGGTISASPNFGYELARTRIKDNAIKDLDLSKWRISVNGAEAVLPSTLNSFNERFSHCGLAPTVIRPVYGLAENSVGLAFPVEERLPRIESIKRSEFSRYGRAVLAEQSDTNPLQFVACGQPLPRHEIRVVDSQGREAAERQEGQIEFRGPSSTQGYYQNAKATQELFSKDGWLRTGDRGYLAGGEIYITGREKDTIIRAGRNIYAAEIEVAAGRVNGVRTGCVAVFGVHPQEGGTEQLVVFAETRIKDKDALAETSEEINQSVLRVLGEPPDKIVLVPPYTVLKTSSGKIRRSACKDLYLQGQHVGGRRLVWLQFIRLYLMSVKPEIRSFIRKISDWTYAFWWWFCAIVLGFVVWPITSIIPSNKFCYLWMKINCKGFLFLVGAKPKLIGADKIPGSGPLVIVPNHTSYLDGLLFIALMPRTIHFVAKNTLEKFPFGRMLKHLGTYFVERFNVRKGAEDAGDISKIVEEGEAVVIFPEGTFGRMPGLLPFRMGAFSVAVESSASILPIGISGLRTMLRSDSWFPRHSSLSLVVGKPVCPQDKSWESAIALRDNMREQLLSLSGEADLRFETGEVEKLKPE